MIIEKVIILRLLIPQINTNSPNFSFDFSFEEFLIYYLVFTVVFERIGREHVFHPIRRWIDINWRTSTWLWRLDFFKNLATYDYHLTKDPRLNTLNNRSTHQQQIDNTDYRFVYWPILIKATHLYDYDSALHRIWKGSVKNFKFFSCINRQYRWTGKDHAQWSGENSQPLKSFGNGLPRLQYIAFTNNEYRKLSRTHLYPPFPAYASFGSEFV